MTNAVFLTSNYIEGAIVTASSEQGTAPATAVQNEQRSQIWRSGIGSSSQLMATLARARPVSYVAFVDVNLTHSGTITIEAWDDAIDGETKTVDMEVAPWLYADPLEPGLPFGAGPFGAGPFGAISTTATINARNVTLVPIAAGISSIFWRFTFSDADSAYQSLGVLYVGGHRSFETNASWGWTGKNIERSVSRESLGGQIYTNPRDQRRQITGAFDWQTDAERIAAQIDFYRFGESKPPVFSLYPDGGDAGLTTTIYGRLSGVSHSGTSYNINGMPFTITEDL